MARRGARTRTSIAACVGFHVVMWALVASLSVASSDASTTWDTDVSGGVGGQVATISSGDHTGVEGSSRVPASVGDSTEQILGVGQEKAQVQHKNSIILSSERTQSQDQARWWKVLVSKLWRIGHKEQSVSSSVDSAPVEKLADGASKDHPQDSFSSPSQLTVSPQTTSESHLTAELYTGVEDSSPGLTSGFKVASAMEQLSSAIEQIEANIVESVADFMTFAQRKLRPRNKESTKAIEGEKIVGLMEEDKHEFLSKRVECRRRLGEYSISTELCACQLMHSSSDIYSHAACLRRVNNRAIRVATRMGMDKVARRLQKGGDRCRQVGSIEGTAEAEKVCLEKALRKYVAKSQYLAAPGKIRKLLSEIDSEEEVSSRSETLSGKEKIEANEPLASISDIIARAVAFTAYLLGSLVIFAGAVDVIRHYRRHRSVSQRNEEFSQLPFSARALYVRLFPQA